MPIKQSLFNLLKQDSSFNADSEALLQLACHPWSPKNHCLFGPQFRETVVQVLWLSGALSSGKVTAPTEIWLHTISLLGAFGRGKPAQLPSPAGAADV